MSIFLLLVVVNTASSSQYHYQNEVNLRADKLSNYDSIVAPTMGVNVTVSLNIYKITSIDMVSGVLEMNGWITQSWNDHRYPNFTSTVCILSTKMLTSLPSIDLHGMFQIHVMPV